MKKFNKFLKENIKKVIIVFLFLQPIIDLLTSVWIHVLDMDITFGIMVRVIFLVLMGYYYVFVKEKENKKKTIIYLSLIILYLISFSIEVLYLKGSSAFLYEIKNMIRVFYAPILLLLLKDEKLDIKTSDLIKIMFIYVLFIVIPTLTKTSFAAYTQGKVGSIGWFNSTNEIAAILAMFFPLLIFYLTKENKMIYKIILLTFTIFAMFTLGSKITIISILITLLINGIVYLKEIIKRRDNKKLGILFTILVIIIGTGIVLIPKTNFYKNIIIHMEFLEIDSCSDLLDVKILDHFVFSQRLTFLSKTNNNYMNSSISEKLLGIGYIENYGTDDVSLKTIEMDYFDIFYRSGIIGFILFFYVFVLVMKDTVKLFFDKLKNKLIDKEYLAYMISLFMILFMSLLSGHVLVSPAVSIFVIIILLRRS